MEDLREQNISEPPSEVSHPGCEELRLGLDNIRSKVAKLKGRLPQTEKPATVCLEAADDDNFAFLQSMRSQLEDEKT